MSEFLVVRLGAMGDVLHAMPAVAALRQAVPSALISWVVDPRWMPLLSAGVQGHDSERMPLVDRIYLANVHAWGARPFSPATLEAVLDLRREIREGSFDAVLDLQGSIRSAVISRFACTRCVVGSATPREMPARWLYTTRVQTRAPHVIQQAVEIVSAACATTLQPVLAPLPRDREAERWCDEMLLQNNADRAEFAVLTPGAGWGAKRWPATRYGEVAAGLDALGLAVYVNCGPGEEAISREVIAASGNRAHLLQAELPQLIAVLRRAKIFLGGDTGPLHLAAALGVPVVGLYGPTDPERNGPYGTRSMVLRHSSSRRDHTRHAATESGLAAIPASAALDAARTLLQQSNSGPGMTLLTNF